MARRLASFLLLPRPMQRTTTALLVIFALATSACVSMVDGNGDVIIPDEPDEPGTETPTPTRSPAQVALLSGTYTVITAFDLTLDVVLPAQAYEVVGVLRDFRVSPAATLFQLLSDAGVPIVGELLAVLPEALEGELMGWIDDYLESAVFGQVPVLEVVDDILDMSHTSLTRFDMVSEMRLIDADGVGSPSLGHRVTAFDFPLADQIHHFPLPDLGPLTHAPADVWIEREDLTSDALLVLGEHTFGLPFGDHAYRAVEAAVTARYGAGIRQTLGAAVNCPELAAQVSNRCALGVCVGHQQELLEICEAGLDQLHAELYERFQAYDFEAMEMTTGEVEMWDALGEPTDGIVDHLLGGQWQSSIDVGMGLRPIDATFVGFRR